MSTDRAHWLWRQASLQVPRRRPRRKIETAYIDPGKPWQNAAGESFNGKFRDERLSLEWFRNRIDAKIMIEGWRRHYNEIRPHSSLGYLTPAEFRQLNSKTNPEESIFQE